MELTTCGTQSLASFFARASAKVLPKKTDRQSVGCFAGCHCVLTCFAMARTLLALGVKFLCKPLLQCVPKSVDSVSIIRPCHISKSSKSFSGVDKPAGNQLDLAGHDEPNSPPGQGELGPI